MKSDTMVLACMPLPRYCQEERPTPIEARRRAGPLACHKTERADRGPSAPQSHEAEEVHVVVVAPTLLPHSWMATKRSPHNFVEACLDKYARFMSAMACKTSGEQEAAADLSITGKWTK